MTVGCLLSLTIPLDSAIAVAGDVVCLCKRLPLDSSAWIACHPRCVADGLNFSLIDIVDLGFSVGATDCYELLVVGIDLEAKHFGVNISKEIDQSGLAVGRVDELDLPRTIGFVVLHVFLVFEYVF